MPIYIVVTIIVLLCALVCFAFISQSIEKRRIQKQRMLMALKTKHRNFVHMINGFPPNFLSTDLLSLIYRALINTCEQLSRIEPNNTRHRDELTLFTNKLSTIYNDNNIQKVHLDNPQQMKDIRQHLQELQRFVAQQEALKTINAVQANTYQEQIKYLAIQMSVDAYMHHAKQAQQDGKIRLAIHYFTLAKKLFAGENSTHSFDKQIAQLHSVITKLEEKALASDEAATEAETTPKVAAAKEWDAFNKKEKDDADWKKKQIYD